MRVSTAEAQRGASLDPSGYDAGKKVLGRKRHILTDTLGLLLAVSVHSASIQDRDGAEALREARHSFPFIERLIGDAGYQGRKMATVVARTGIWELQIVRRCDQHRFVAAEKMDRRTHPRMDQPLSSARPRLRASRSKGGSVRPPCHDPPDAAPSRPSH